MANGGRFPARAFVVQKPPSRSTILAHVAVPCAVKRIRIKSHTQRTWRIPAGTGLPEDNCDNLADDAIGFAKERVFASGPRGAGFGHD
jgi:hypothetical protein